MRRMNHLTEQEILTVLDLFDQKKPISIDRVRPHNRGEIRKSVLISVSELKQLIHLAIQEGHQPGGDLEIPIPGTDSILVGHHDGIYWLEEKKNTPNQVLNRTVAPSGSG